MYPQRRVLRIKAPYVTWNLHAGLKRRNLGHLV